MAKSTNTYVGANFNKMKSNEEANFHKSGSQYPYPCYLNL